MINPPDRVKSCKQCDLNAVCYGSNLLAPRAGYYRSDNLSETILECYNERACIGGSEVEPLGLCQEGYHGFMCGSCQQDYYKMNWLECGQCPSYNTSLVYAFFRWCWFTVLILGMTSLQTSISVHGNRQKKGFMQLIKLIVNHSVIMAAISDIKFNWSETVQTVLKI